MRSPKSILNAVEHGLKSVSTRIFLHSRLQCRDFSIVSNNCWGGHIYQKIGMEYRSPFAGLFLAPECYLNLLRDFHRNLCRPLKFAANSRHGYINRMRAEKNDRSPIGLLGDDIELHFVHYETVAEAENKWSRRLLRMVKDEDRLFFKFCDRDGCTPGQLAEFDALPFRNKVCFVSHENHGLKYGLYIPGAKDGQVPDGGVLGKISPRFFDGVDWLNGNSGKTHWPNLFRFI